MATILAIAYPSDPATTIGYYYVRRFAERAANLGHRVIFQKTPTVEALYKAIQTYDPRLIVANGHGGFKSLEVDNNVIIGVKGYDEAINRKIHGENPEWFRGRLVLLLTCNAGSQLAERLIEHGAESVMAFKQPFIFLTEEHKSPQDDQEARPFFISLLQSALQIADGKTFGEACQTTKQAFTHYTQEFEKKGDVQAAQYLYFDLENIVCLGNPEGRL